MLIEILVVCTGNVCRSPLAALLLRRALDERGVTARVRSAGLLSDGRAVPEPNLRVAQARGLDLASHESARMTADMVRDADLVLGMACTHVREAVALEPSAWPRVFTLKSLVRRAEAAGPRPPDTPVEKWLGTLQGAGGRDNLLGDSSIDDVLDPIGRSDVIYEEVATEIEVKVHRLVDLLWPE